jgi:RNA polymerase sigma factor (TIGR02999 family)
VEIETVQRDVTRLLQDWQEGSEEALDELTPLIYDELRRMARRAMRRERPGHTLGSTALAHEAFLQILQQRVQWQSRGHFFGVVARLMRRVTVHHAERHRAAKRGGGVRPETIDESLHSSQARPEEVLALEEAVARLEQIDPRQGRIVELRFFGGYNADEIAEALEVSPATVHRDWRLARAWLRRELDAEAATAPAPEAGATP